jgi:hypothetical protein
VSARLRLDDHDKEASTMSTMNGSFREVLEEDAGAPYQDFTVGSFPVEAFVDEEGEVLITALLSSEGGQQGDRLALNLSVGNALGLMAQLASVIRHANYAVAGGVRGDYVNAL